MILAVLFQNLLQDLEMLFMGVGVYQKVLNVLEVSKYSFHETLKRGRTHRGGPSVTWSSGTVLCPELWKPWEAEIVHLVSFARIRMWDPESRRSWNLLIRSHQCIPWFPSWNICGCVSFDLVPGSPAQSRVLVLVSLVRRIWEGCITSLTSGLLPILTILPVFAQ